MTERRYSRNLIELLLVRTAILESYRIMPRRHVGSPLGTTPADSRFATRTGSYTMLYAAPDFTTAFIETIVRDRFAHRRFRVVVPSLRNLPFPSRYGHRRLAPSGTAAQSDRLLWSDDWLT